MAVSDRGGTVRFTADGDTVNRIASGDASGRSLIEVPATTLDALFAERAPRVVKIDVEGHEGAVLDGGRRLLASDEVAALVVEMGEQGDRAARSLVEHGFEAARYEPFARNLTRGSGPGRAGNAIWVRDRAWAEARLREARPISVNGVAV
ncbi:MAG: FkbM family methyltransferase [Geminicoccaceae bacterium]|nr:FkbM family methyltransferase [Geminicoccaceae bacterium]